MKNKLSDRRIVRYVLAGGLSYAIELACLVALHWGAGLSSEAATAIAFWIGLFTSFFFQKLFAFQDYQKTVRAITHQVIGYGLLVAFNYAFTLLVVAVFPARLVIVSRTLALLITTAWNYFFYKKILFHKDLSGRIAALWTRWRRKLLFGGLATVPLLVFFWGYLSSGQKLIVGDFDYYAQLYEAFRLSVVHYHQFPLWNPWMSGGLPLFANPQFGLFSLQSLLVLPLGAVYGLKLSYVIYAVAGFWGMYVLCRRMFASSKLRALLISYIWIFCGFFAGHNISHYTFALFFLLPWLVYFVFRRNRKWSWLWFGLLESLIILSSIHYALLMMAFVLVLYLLVSFMPVETGRRGLTLEWQLHLSDLMFGAKALGVIVVLAGYRFITTYSFIAANEKSSIVLHDMPNTPVVLLKALFLPIGNHLAAPANLQWGWAEYSMYIGLGAGLALVCVVVAAVIGLARRDFPRITSLRLLVTILAVGVITFFIALGDSSKTSLFHVLRDLPGFSQTRVASRWLVFTMFALLIFLAAWPKNKKLVNLLLALSVVELFAWYSLIGARAQEVAVPKAHFSAAFNEYDNGRKHLDAATHPMHFYYYTTGQNLGQIYSDDSTIETLDGVLNTSKCGINVNPRCTFVLTHNARVTYWSPNKIVLHRTAPGSIELNMNAERDWLINGGYPYAAYEQLNPAQRFILGGNAKTYKLEYAPKLSWQWAAWRAQHH